jgi:hypothetical protein
MDYEYSTLTLDVFGFGFESVGALGFTNEYSGLAAQQLAMLASQNPVCMSISIINHQWR